MISVISGLTDTAVIVSKTLEYGFFEQGYRKIPIIDLIAALFDRMLVGGNGEMRFKEGIPYNI
jgi:hypothetical protein